MEHSLCPNLLGGAFQHSREHASENFLRARPQPPVSLTVIAHTPDSLAARMQCALAFCFSHHVQYRKLLLFNFASIF